MRSTRGRRIACNVTSVGLVAFLLASCGASNGSERADPAQLNAYHRSDQAFYKHFVLGEGESEAYNYDTLAAAGKAATAVAVAEVTGVRITRTMTAKDGPPGGWPMIGIDLHPVEVLHGSLPSQFQETLTVEFSGDPGHGDEDVAILKERLPQGQQVWFLRSKDDAYRMKQEYYESKGQSMPEEIKEHWEQEKDYWTPVSFEGLFVQGETHVVSAFAGRPIDGAGEEGEGYAKLSDLATFARKLPE